MDYKALIENAKVCCGDVDVEECAEVCLHPQDKRGKELRWCRQWLIHDLHTAFTDLLASAEAAEARCKILETRLETAEKMVKEYQDELIPGYRERAEKAEMEMDAALSDLTYIARSYPVDLCDDIVCQYCKHYQNVNAGCPGWTENDCFEWRGAKEK